MRVAAYVFADHRTIGARVEAELKADPLEPDTEEALIERLAEAVAQDYLRALQSRP